MARIAGVNIPQNKLVYVGLTYIYGIGDRFSNEICKALSIPKSKRGIWVSILFSSVRALIAFNKLKPFQSLFCLLSLNV